MHALCIMLFLVVSIPLMAQKKNKKAKNADQSAITNTTMQADTVKPTNTEGGGGGAEAALPYMAEYSSKFTIGNQEHARMVLKAWKDYDDNMLDNSASIFADTVMFQTPGGQVIRGKDSMMMALKQYRGQFSGVKSTVDAWVPMHSTDKNEDWVLIWGTENDTNASGTTPTVLHEIWRINRDGKIDFVRQYAAKSPVQ